MLDDPRSDQFVENFTGQWLQLRKLGRVARDKDLFRGFDDTLRDAMRQETEQYFAYILRNNRSVLELLDSDYTFVNEALARHYEIEGVTGDAVSAGRTGGSAARWRADAGERAHADFEPEPDVAGESAGSGSCSRFSGRRRRRRRPKSPSSMKASRPPTPPRCASAWSCTGPSRNARRAISRWIRWASRSRI